MHSGILFSAPNSADSTVTHFVSFSPALRLDYDFVLETFFFRIQICLKAIKHHTLVYSHHHKLQVMEQRLQIYHSYVNTRWLSCQHSSPPLQQKVRSHCCNPEVVMPVHAVRNRAAMQCYGGLWRNISLETVSRREGTAGCAALKRLNMRERERERERENGITK